MPKSTNLSLVEDVTQTTENASEEVAPVEEATAQEAQAEPEQGVPSLEDRFAAIEARLLQLEQMAHIEHQMSLGPNELNAIGNALEKHIKIGIITVLKEHLGIAPPAIRGDSA